MRALVVASTISAAMTPALGQGLESMEKANNLGSVIAAEEMCGLSYDQQAIAAWIEQNIAADDMSSAGTLQTMVQGHEFQDRSMSTSQRTAHCAQIRRVARSYGFVD